MTKVILTCRLCGHEEDGLAERELMNRIKMWNHVRRAHPWVEPSRLSHILRVSSPSTPSMADLVEV